MRDQRAKLARELSTVRLELPSVDELMPRLREKLRDIEDTLKADIAMGRPAAAGLPGRAHRGNRDSIPPRPVS
jgi:hypothetical protein